MKKYIVVFIGTYFYFYLLGIVAFFLCELFAFFLIHVYSGLPYSFHKKAYVGMMIPPIIFAMGEVYRRWKEPNEIESYLDAQNDKQKIEEYLSENKSITNISDSVMQDKQTPKD